MDDRNNHAGNRVIDATAAPVVVTVGNVSTISGITNAASYGAGAVSPGEFIAIFGHNIGPQVPVTLYMIAVAAETAFCIRCAVEQAPHTATVATMFNRSDLLRSFIFDSA